MGSSSENYSRFASSNIFVTAIKYVAAPLEDNVIFPHRASSSDAKPLSSD